MLRTDLARATACIALIACSEPHDDGGSRHDATDAYETLCIAATSEAACRDVELPRLTNCTDCGHACLWLPLREVARVDGGCEYGESSGLCVYRQIGEDPSFKLRDLCLGSGSSGGDLWLDRSGAIAKVGFVGLGAVSHPDLERCTDYDYLGDPFALAPECECPCQPGYPDAECEALGQNVDPPVASGIEVCPGVPDHRVSRERCTTELSEPACDPDRGMCSTDDDCASGSCVGCLCIVPCVADADCDAGESCVCGTRYAHLSQCVPSLCATDADCAQGEVCALSYGRTHRGGSCEVQALWCRAPYAECDGTRCGDSEMCTVDPDSGDWACSSDDRCRR